MTIKITLTKKLDGELKGLLEQLQEEHKDMVEGVYDLYDSLYVNGEVGSYNKTRAYYVAYTLADNNIDFTIE